MDTTHIDQVFEEIRQLKEQYEAEVGRARKAWPKSIRDRVSALDALGLQYRVVAERSGIPPNTLYTWMTRVSGSKSARTGGTFVSLPVRASEILPSNASKKRLPKSHGKSPTVTVKIGDRIEITGLSALDALKVVRGLSL